MKYIVAITGGIGSGKSTIARIFSQFGIDVVDTDTIARQIVQPGTQILKSIIKRFTNASLNYNGTLNRKFLRERILFNHSDKEWLNAICHPVIYQESLRQITVTTSPYVIWVVPLLIENKLYKNVNRILVVDVIPEIQIQRTMKRDNVPQSHVEKILMIQTKREDRLIMADDIIDNSNTLSYVISTVSRLHTKYLQFAMNNFLKIADAPYNI